MAESDLRATFFPKKRIRVELSGWTPKKNAQGEKRLRLDFTIPLTDKTRDGVLPSWLIHELAAFERDESHQTNTKFDVELEGVTMELFELPKAAADKLELLTSTTLSDFVLVRVTRDKSTFPALTFCINVKRTWGLMRFADKYEGCYLWSDFTPADPEIPSKPTAAQMTIGDATRPRGGPGSCSDKCDPETCSDPKHAEKAAERNIGNFFRKGQNAQAAVDKTIADAARSGNDKAEKATAGAGGKTGGKGRIN